MLFLFFLFSFFFLFVLYVCNSYIQLWAASIDGLRPNWQLAIIYTVLSTMYISSVANKIVVVVVKRPGVFCPETMVGKLLRKTYVFRLKNPQNPKRPKCRFLRFFTSVQFLHIIFNFAFKSRSASFVTIDRKLHDTQNDA